MKKKEISLLLLLLAYSMFGQDKETASFIGFSMTDLEIPNSAAFVLLDAAPETIQRPNSTKAFGLSLLQDIATDGILKNIAIEATPFWLTQNRNRSALKYYGVDKSGVQNPFSKLKLASFSAAYVKDTDSIVNVAIGGRVTLFELKRKTIVLEYLSTYKEIENLISHVSDVVEEEYDAKNPEPDCFGEPNCDKILDEWDQKRNEYKKMIRNRITLDGGQSLMDEVDDSKGYSEKMEEIVQTKPWLAVDLAAAYNHRIMNNEFNNNKFGRIGMWGTVALNTKWESDNYINFYGFVRYLMESENEALNNVAPDDRFNAFDIGVKGEFELAKLTVGYEYISRSGDLEGYRSAGTIKYQLLENIFLTGSFGNNFEKKDDLISLFGIQWGVNNSNQKLGVTNNF